MESIFAHAARGRFSLIEDSKRLQNGATDWPFSTRHPAGITWREESAAVADFPRFSSHREGLRGENYSLWSDFPDGGLGP